MDLDQSQKAAVAQWVADGLQLDAVQKRIAAEFGVRMTYMDVRFLVDDLGVVVEDVASAPSMHTDLSRAPDPPEGASHRAADPVGSVSVEVDRVMKPGSLVSGSVVFSDGVTAMWTLDQLGRLGLSASQAGYKPSESDLQAFQGKLSEALQRQGF